MSLSHPWHSMPDHHTIPRHPILSRLCSAPLDSHSSPPFGSSSPALVTALVVMLPLVRSRPFSATWPRLVDAAMLVAHFLACSVAQTLTSLSIPRCHTAAWFRQFGCLGQYRYQSITIITFAFASACAPVGMSASARSRWPSICQGSHIGHPSHWMDFSARSVTEMSLAC